MKHKPVKQNEFYKAEDALVRNRKNCPRCGDTFLAEHKQPDKKIRYYCGKCRLSSWE